MFLTRLFDGAPSTDAEAAVTERRTLSEVMAAHSALAWSLVHQQA